MADVLERATTGRAGCRGCGRKIEKGGLRFGESLPNPFGDGDATFWFHLSCAACNRSEKLLAALASAELDVPDRERIERVAAIGVAHPRSTRLLHAERAASGRARCRSCKELIPDGAWRLSLGIFEDGRTQPIGFIHAECSQAYFETRKLGEHVALLTPDLSHEDLGELTRILARAPESEASPGLVQAKAEAGPSLAKAPAGEERAAEAKPAGQRTRR